MASAPLNPYLCRYRLNGALVCRETYGEPARSRMPVHLTEHKGEPATDPVAPVESSWRSWPGVASLHEVQRSPSTLHEVQRSPSTLQGAPRPAAAAAPLVGQSTLTVPASVEPAAALPARPLTCPRPLQRPPLPRPAPNMGTNVVVFDSYRD